VQKQINSKKQSKNYSKKDYEIQKSVIEIQIQKRIMEKKSKMYFYPYPFKGIFIISHKNQVQVQIGLGAGSNCLVIKRIYWPIKNQLGFKPKPSPLQMVIVSGFCFLHPINSNIYPINF